MLKRQAPRREGGRVEIAGSGGEEVIEVGQHPLDHRVLAPQRPLECQVALDAGSQDRRERRLHDVTSVPSRESAGRSNATSRRSSTANRRYTHVLSKVRWPKRSPIVFSAIPDRRRYTAYECRRQ